MCEARQYIRIRLSLSAAIPRLATAMVLWATAPDRYTGTEPVVSHTYLSPGENIPVDKAAQRQQREHPDRWQISTDRQPHYLNRQRKSVSYTHLRAHETGRNLVCRL